MNPTGSTLDRIRQKTEEFRNQLREQEKQARLDGYPVEIPRLIEEVMQTQTEYIKELEEELEAALARLLDLRV